ncbi:hypothetical protein BACCAP_03530 [Pseudoflavonifractor capillosus ATCC 29799]|uniref:Arc-like DNA binding domain-containing protein n=2 Tax=Pseudoflavonifractor capillosus TaxID=106588 RepID=A6NZ79_9FIRM|nr:hypothetical protein BACCAP_03530 [Pseudoflavonifractor capillosus ATCC 29799]
MQKICFVYRKETRHMEKNHLSIRTDKAIHDKLQYIAAYEGRSMSGQILYLINTCIRDFEKEHGPIRPEDLK